MSIDCRCMSLHKKFYKERISMSIAVFDHAIKMATEKVIKATNSPKLLRIVNHAAVANFAIEQIRTDREELISGPICGSRVVKDGIVLWPSL